MTATLRFGRRSSASISSLVKGPSAATQVPLSSSFSRFVSCCCCSSWRLRLSGLLRLALVSRHGERANVDQEPAMTATHKYS
ncbi:MAG: hypothetical protein INR71_01970 [Terriglobus roseus]|nr:hypothetical protein [Terriglobus roseus]